MEQLKRLEVEIKSLKKNNQDEGLEQQEMTEEFRVGNALQHLDGLWWKMRLEFDNYLDAADLQVKTFKETLKVLSSYVNKCTANFAGLKTALVSWARVERQTHLVLKQVWTNVLPLLGEMTAGLRDGAYLLQFAQDDVHGLNVTDKLGLSTPRGREQFCTQNGQQSVVEKAVNEAIQSGICGQTVRQVMAALGHTLMLGDRFVFAGLGSAPNAEMVTESAKDVEAARLAILEVKPAHTMWVLKQVSGLCSS